MSITLDRNFLFFEICLNEWCTIPDLSKKLNCTPNTVYVYIRGFKQMIATAEITKFIIKTDYNFTGDRGRPQQKIKIMIKERR